MNGNHFLLVHKSPTAGAGTTCGDVPSGSPLTPGEKYAAIDKLGMLMKTHSGDGTTDENFIKGIVDYINGRGHTGDFKVKVYNHPSFREYAHELDTGDEDVLVGITYTTGDLKGTGHWLVGRSFGPKNDNGTPTDLTDDFWPVSFVDPWTGSVYHSEMRATPTGFKIWYNGQWVDFDIMVSVSPVPTEERPNGDTAQFFVAKNSFMGIDPVSGQGAGSVIFTLLGSIDPQDVENFRTLPLTPGPDHRLALVRLKLMAMNEGAAEIRFENPDASGGPAIQLVKVVDGTVGAIPQVMWASPAARIVVGNVIDVAVRLQSPNTRPNPRGWENMPLTIKLFTPSSGGMPTGTPAAEFACPRLSKQGNFGVCTVPTNVSGFFDVFVSSARTLLHVKRHVQLPGRVEFNQPLVEGDLNNDNQIGIADFSLWVNTWRQKSTVTPERNIQAYSQGDLAALVEVDITDFGIFAGNWRIFGPVEDDQLVIALLTEHLPNQDDKLKQQRHAILTQLGPDLHVEVMVEPADTAPQLNHIHTGQCGVGLSTPSDTLAPVVNGQGSTLLSNLTIDSLRDGDHAVNVHWSGDPDVYTACGNIPLSPNPPKDTDGRREGSGRGWVRELQGRWPGVLG